MNRMRLFRGIALGLITLAGSLVTASPAHAYGSYNYDYLLVDTGNCAKLGPSPWTVVTRSDGCFINDSAGGTLFRKDAGGIAIKIVVYNGSGAMVAKVEFHPYGEVLRVFDTRNDNDTVYTFVTDGDFDLDGPYYAPGTSDPIDSWTANLDMPEDQPVELWVYDDADRFDYMFRVIGGKA